MRRAKIVATIGPMTKSPEMLRRLVNAGMDVARLNFSHGTRDSYREIIADIRRVSQELDQPVAVLQDLQGVKIRTGKLIDGQPVSLVPGAPFSITTEELLGDARRVSTYYEDLPKDVTVGDRVLLSDGLIELRVTGLSETQIDCQVVTGGKLAENQGINIPGAVITAPSLTEKDMEDAHFGIDQGVDFIALSFVRKAQDVLVLKDLLAARQSDIPVIAKLEKPAAIDNLEGIMEVCEGVMVARGDLGVEMSPERVPMIQKRIIHTANQRGKLVITATQMLDSMIRNPRPTRAEASDVANAIFDGTDAVMLSGETATGDYPVESVKMMVRIIEEAEKLGAVSPYRTRTGDEQLSFPQAVCVSAYHASTAIRARAIVAFSQTGSTARMISKYRPPVEILGFTPHCQVVNRMCLYWGVRPMLMDTIANVDELIQALERHLLERKLADPGNNLIILTGAPILERGHTSLMKLHTVKTAPVEPEQAEAAQNLVETQQS